MNGLMEHEFHSANRRLNSGGQVPSSPVEIFPHAYQLEKLWIGIRIKDNCENFITTVNRRDIGSGNVPTNYNTNKNTQNLRTKFTFKAVFLIFFAFFSNCVVADTPDNQAFQSAYQKKELQLKSEIEKQHRQIKKDAEASINKEAVDVVSDTKKAIAAIDRHQAKEALGIIEVAIGKISILLTQEGKPALLPVDFVSVVIDAAPSDLTIVKKINKLIERETLNHHYPEVRMLLESLRSELNIQIYSLPLAFYPDALKESGRLLREQKLKEAKEVLITALNTLIVTYKITPLPILNAKALLLSSEEYLEEDKKIALRMAKEARSELIKAKELGYAGLNLDVHYRGLLKEIDKVERQIASNQNSKITFGTLRKKLEEFLDLFYQKKKQLSHQSSN